MPCHETKILMDHASLISASRHAKAREREPWLRSGLLPSLSISAFVIAAAFALTGLRAAGQTVLFFDDFNGATLDPIWQASLPDAPLGGGPSPIETYIGAPNYTFDSTGGTSILRLDNNLNPQQRQGWSSSTNFTTTDFRYEMRFNTLGQSGYSIDGLVEIWVLDATDPTRHDIVSPFGGNYGNSRRFFAGSTIDNAYTETPFNYQDNTWYRVALAGGPGQNVRASILSDDGTELVGRTFSHDASAFSSGFKIGFSQAVGTPAGSANVLVGVDSIRLTTAVLPGLSIGLYPGLTLRGIAGKSYQIEYLQNLRSSNWTTLTTLTLVEATQLWFDADNNVSSGAHPRRFYRATLVP